MAELRSHRVNRGPVLRREVIVPRQSDAASIHRTAAILSICIALVAGTIDAMLWQSAQRRAAESYLGTTSQRARGDAPPDAISAADTIVVDVARDAAVAPSARSRQLELAPGCDHGLVQREER